MGAGWGCVRDPLRGQTKTCPSPPVILASRSQPGARAGAEACVFRKSKGGSGHSHSLGSAVGSIRPVWPSSPPLLRPQTSPPLWTRPGQPERGVGSELWGGNSSTEQASGQASQKRGLGRLTRANAACWPVQSGLTKTDLGWSPQYMWEEEGTFATILKDKAEPGEFKGHVLGPLPRGEAWIQTQV